jgi:predicted patatin/cPLA2 family phospholipase
VLDAFADSEELMQAMGASAWLPRLGGAAPVFRGERMGDGGLIEPIPYQAAPRQAATHVLVLRSRPAGYRRPLISALDLAARGRARGRL